MCLRTTLDDGKSKLPAGDNKPLTPWVSAIQGALMLAYGALAIVIWLYSSDQKHLHWRSVVPEKDMITSEVVEDTKIRPKWFITPVFAWAFIWHGLMLWKAEAEIKRFHNCFRWDMWLVALPMINMETATIANALDTRLIFAIGFLSFFYALFLFNSELVAAETRGSSAEVFMNPVPFLNRWLCCDKKEEHSRPCCKFDPYNGSSYVWMASIFYVATWSLIFTNFIRTSNNQPNMVLALLIVQVIVQACLWLHCLSATRRVKDVSDDPSKIELTHLALGMVILCTWSVIQFAGIPAAIADAA